MTSSRRFAAGVGALAVVGPLAGAANFAFHAIASRALGPDGYSALNVLLALTIAVAIPAAAVQMSLARSLLSGAVSATGLRLAASRGATVVTIMTIALAPAVSAGLRLDTVAPVVALVGYLVATIVGLVPKAVLVSQERFGALAAGTLAGVVVRLGLGFLWVASGGDLTAAVAAGSIGEIVVTGYLLWTTRAEYTREVGHVGTWRAHVGPVLGFGCLWAFLAVDIAASRAGMSATAAGAYTAAAVLARAVLFLPQSVAMAAFARLADPLTRARALAWSTAAALALSVLGVCALVVVGTAAASVLFGPGYDIDPRPLIVLGSGAAVMSVVNVWVHARVAYGQPVGLRMVLALGIAVAGARPAAAVGSTALACWMLVAAAAALWLVRPRSTVAAPFPDPNSVPGSSEVDLSIVLPAYNAARELGSTLVAVEAVLASTGRSFEVLVVDDGSTDATAAVAEAAAGPASRVLQTSHRGKGGALQAGLAQARGRIIGFIDADGDVDPVILRHLIEATSAEGVDGAIAVKRAGCRGPLRRVASAGYRVVVRAVLSVGVSDTQTGAKVFRRDTVAAVLPWLSETGFAWDAEFLAAAHRLGFRSITEVTVDVGSSSSTIRPDAAWEALRATLRIGSRVAMLPGYEPAGQAAEGQTVPRAAAPHPAVPTQLMSGRTRALRILVLTWKCHRHPAAGGAEVYTQEVAARWAAAGHEVTVFAPAVPGLPAREVVSGYVVHRRGSRFSVYREARHFWHERKADFDVIVDEVNTRPFESPLWADVPVVALFYQLARDVWFHELSAPVAAAGRYVFEPAWLRAYRDVPVATISDSSAASLSQAGLGRVVNVGVGGSTTADLVPVTKGDVPRVAFLGRMVSAKRPLDALAAFDLARTDLGEGAMTLMGAGPIAHIVEEKARQVRGAQFVGRVSQSEKLHHLARAHVLVVTSVREGWGLVVDEAAALGAYPIGYRVPGLIDSVPAAGGTLVDPNPRALATALVARLPHLVSQPALVRRGGARSWDDVAQRLLSVVATATRPLERV